MTSNPNIPDAEQNIRADIPLDSISNAPLEVIPDSDTSKLLEQRQLEYEAAKFRTELGWIGLPFGGRNEKPGNVSALIIVLCFLYLAMIYIWPPKADSGISFERIHAGIVSIITLILGYLFGSNEKNR